MNNNKDHPLCGGPEDVNCHRDRTNDQPIQNQVK